ncbi:MAG: SCP2 sterol-binding domain-containing protein [Actinobacteria bacterium]|nr:SCP2 sterol-binding domain-containing protein [Actinomycetota bacterium]
MRRARRGTIVPSKDEVASKLQELIERLDGAGGDVRDKLARAVPSRVIQIHVSDLDVYFWTELDGGRMDGLYEGSSPDADITITATGEDLVDMIDGRKSMFSSVIAGHVHVDASLADLMSLRKLL